ncbi:MAG TPA: hypothetical protein VMS64_26870 [Candidatus Methylomirabilis sp.]|nr:hypothetical protein [Candidatus Methylomirabilis sp.]
MHPPEQALWYADWAWSLPLIVLTVVIHVLGLWLLNGRVIPPLSTMVAGRHATGAFVVVMGITILLVTFLHGVEAAIWAGAYLFLEALPNPRSAMLYSLGSMTTFGHANLFLRDHWQLMGALEALNGIILFGLTTAFLFARIQRIWPLGSEEPHRGF